MDDLYKDHEEGEIVSEALVCGISKMCNVGTCLQTSRMAVNQAFMYPSVYAAVGIHPNMVGQHDLTDLQEIEALASNPAVVGIGEIGLDYFHKASAQELQQKWFKAQIRIAKKLGLPVLVHCRNAYDDCYRILKQEGVTRGVMHCFLGTAEQAKKFMELGLYISFSGIVTFKNAKDLIPVVKSVPINRLLLETDAPYLAPQQYRGKINYPKYITFVAQAIANIKHIELAELIRMTSKNANSVFSID